MRPTLPLLLAALLAVAAHAGSERSSAPLSPGDPSKSQAGTLPATNGEHPLEAGVDEPLSAGSAPLYHLNWYSVNGGGETNVNGTHFDLGVSVGQAAAGFVTGTSFRMGVGFWYGVGGGACPITLSGDVNNTTTITSADIIYLVNYVFKGGADPLPCAANGDVNCSGTITSADIIYMVNYVFKGGSAPCDICTMIPSTWSCP